MRFWISLCFLALFYPNFGVAGTPKDFVEQLPTGRINWTTGVLEAKGNCPFFPAAVQSGAPPQRPSLQASRQAAQNALDALKQVRLDGMRDVADMMVDKEIAAKVRQIAKTAEIFQEVRLPDGALEATVRVYLLGGFSQLMLPQDIKQLESIRQVRPITGSDRQDLIGSADGGYTGLIVDARGINAKPALVPLLVDESGKQVYGSAFVSREYAVQYGMCEYMRSIDVTRLPARVAPIPLTVKGLRTLSGRQCDIVISNADAARLRGASATLDVLKQCRVIIVLD
jgi:hypothetical protein